MKSSSLILCLALWSASLVGAYFYGSSKQNAPEQAATVAKNEKKERTVAIEVDKEALETETAESQLVAYLKGEAVTLQEALEDISSLPAGEARLLLNDAFALPASDPNRSRMIRELIEHLAETDPLGALEIANSIESLRDSERARIAALEVWGRNDPASALAWANHALADEPHRSRHSKLDAIYRGYAETNPQAAFQQAMLIEDNRLTTGILEDVIATQIENGGLEAAKLRIDTLNDPELQSRLRRELVDEWASYDPVSASKYVDSLGEDASSYLKANLVEEWAESDPAAAAAWLSSLDPSDPAIARASADLIQEWIRYDLTASAEWLNSLEPSSELDRAVVSYTFRAAEEDPATAMSWAESIEDDRRRTWMMERVAGTWKEQSPETFESYLADADLTAEQKETLSNATASCSTNSTPTICGTPPRSSCAPTMATTWAKSGLSERQARKSMPISGVNP